MVLVLWMIVTGAILDQKQVDLVVHPGGHLDKRYDRLGGYMENIGIVGC